MGGRGSGPVKGSQRSSNYRWCACDDQKLRDNADKGAAFIANLLGLTKMQIYTRARRLGIKVTMPRSATNQRPRPMCDICKERPVGSQGWVNGKRRWAKMCSSCKNYSYRQHKKHYCEGCGFIPQSKVQLDVDHIDGNRLNNDVSNLQTLCANCHRLKTFESNDHRKRYG